MPGIDKMDISGSLPAKMFDWRGSVILRTPEEGCTLIEPAAAAGVTFRIQASISPVPQLYILP